MVNLYCWLLLLSGMFCVAGCRSVNGMIDIQKPLVNSLSKYRIIEVEVSSKDPDFGSKEINQLADSIVIDLRQSNQFEKVYAASTAAKISADLKLSVAIQLVIGPSLHGKQSIESVVTLVETTEGQTLAVAKVSAITGPGLIGVKPIELNHKLANQITDFILKI